MSEAIFLTGGTGFLGSYLLRILLQQKEKLVISLSRGSTRKEAKERIYKAISLRQNQINSYNIKIVLGDIRQKNLGLSYSIYNNIAKQTTVIYHTAALCDFGASLSLARQVNVRGTENVLKFALQCKKNKGFKGVHYISTVAVAGSKKGIFKEKDLEVGQGFNNAYEQSKFEAEQLVVRYREKGLPITVYRPSIITGHSKTGYTSNFRVFYQPLHIFSLELFDEIPADKNSLHYLTPVDTTAESIHLLSTQIHSNNQTYHVFNPHGITFGSFLDVASKYFNFHKPKMIPFEDFPKEKLTPIQWALIEPYVPYFNYKIKFHSKKTNSVLNKTSFNWPEVDGHFLKRLFKFCLISGFLKRKKNKLLK